MVAFELVAAFLVSPNVGFHFKLPIPNEEEEPRWQGQLIPGLRRLESLLLLRNGDF